MQQMRGVAGTELPEIGVGMLGYAFMGKAHSAAFLNVRQAAWPPSLQPRLVAIAGRDESAVAETASRYGYERWTTDWRDIVADPTIGLFDNGGPNSVHAEPTIAAAKAGKHVLCEKPLGRTANEAYAIWASVAATGVKHLCGFNYRFVPAVRLAREIIESGGARRDSPLPRAVPAGLGGGSGPRHLAVQPQGHRLGCHRRPCDPRHRPEPVPRRRDLGALGRGEDLHSRTQGRRRDRVRSRIRCRRSRDDRGDAARARPPQRLPWEINGSKASLWFDMERMNELQVFRADGDRQRGAKTVLVTEADHPFIRYWWPPGHIVGWGDTFTHEVVHLLDAIANDSDVAPYGATFEDGYRASEVCDAIVRSSGRGQAGSDHLPLALDEQHGRDRHSRQPSSRPAPLAPARARPQRG